MSGLIWTPTLGVSDGKKYTKLEMAQISDNLAQDDRSSPAKLSLDLIHCFSCCTNVELSSRSLQEISNFQKLT